MSISRELRSDDVVLRHNVLSSFEVMLSDPSLKKRPGDAPETLDERISVSAIMERIHANPRLAVELLSYEGTILYAGPYADEFSRQRRLGVSLRDGGTRVVGDNLYGEILMEVREACRREITEGRYPVSPQRPGQVVTPFVTAHEAETAAREDAEAAFLEERGTDVFARQANEARERGRKMKESVAQEGNETNVENTEGLFVPQNEQALSSRRRTGDRAFITDRDADRDLHVEPIDRYARRFDTSLKDGTTGHAALPGTGIANQVWSCPFGLDGRYPVRVGTAAEAAFLFERGLKGELDYKVLASDLRQRGLLSATMPSRDVNRLMEDMKSQFSWMRERIMRDSVSLSRCRIISDGTVIPDGSYGRSLYDPLLAPSPADVLAHYVNNPHLLFDRGHSLVVGALDAGDRNETLRFAVTEASGSIDIIVDGSDTIGGRVPGTRAVRSSSRDSSGRRVSKASFQFKTDTEIERDYAALAMRLDSILANMPENVKVRFITSAGVGVPAMVRRYVSDHGGGVFEWDYSRSRAVAEARYDARSRFSVLRLRDFETVLPVLAGRESSVTFLPTASSDGQAVRFSGEGVEPQCAVTFTVAADARNRDIMRRGGFLADRGLPLVVVSGTESEEEHKARLATALADACDDVFHRQNYPSSLFEGIQERDWPLDTCLAVRDELFENFGSLVYVGGVGLSSVYAVYAGLLMTEAGNATPESLRALQQTAPNGLVSAAASVKADWDVRERCMRNAVHAVVRANATLADWLFSTGELPLAVPLSGPAGPLFTDSRGHGKNRWGLVLMAERSAVAERYARENAAAEKVARDIADQNARLRHRSDTRRAHGEKVRDGLPQTAAAASDAVWLLGTNDVPGLALPPGHESVQEWIQERPDDYPCRGLAERGSFPDERGGSVPNRFIFLFPTDLQAHRGLRHVTNYADSPDLTGLRRVDPATGKEFVCAYGIPVRRDNRYYEADNPQGRISSFLNDNDARDLAIDAVNAYVQAAVTVFQLPSDPYPYALCYGRRSRSRVASVERVRDPQTGAETVRRIEEPNDDLSRVFNAVVYDYPRVDANAPHLPTGRMEGQPGSIIEHKVTRTEVNPLTGELETRVESYKRKEYVPSPHAAPRLKAVMQRLLGVLGNNARYPLNCVRLPKDDYSNVPEEVFLADFAFTLSIVNGMAVAMDRPMRFPLDRDGRLDLGPGVPQEYVTLAGRKLDSFISVVRQEEVITGELPEVIRVSVSETAPVADMRPTVYVAVAGDEAVREGDSVLLMTPVTDSETLRRADVVYRSAFPEGGGLWPADTVMPEKTVSDIAADFQEALDEGRDTVLMCRTKEQAERALAVFGEALGARGIECSPIAGRGAVRGRILRGNGADIYLRPTALVSAFGAFDYSFILAGQRAPMHEMAFRMTETVDGREVTNWFRLTDPRLNTSFSIGEQNRYIRYEKNDECHFRITATDPDRIDAFLGVVRSYIERAAQTAVSYELLSEEQAYRENLELGLEGFVDLLPSNSHDLARSGQTAARGHETAVDMPNRFDGNEREAADVYYGHRDSRDGFTGWVRYRATLPDGTPVSGIIENRELALQLVLSQTRREINSDVHFVPERRVLDCMVRSYAVRENAFLFRSAGQQVHTVVADDKTVTVGLAASPAETAPEASVSIPSPYNVETPGEYGTGRLFVTYYGSAGVPENAYRVQISTTCPKDMQGRMDVRFESLYPDYRTMVAPNMDGCLSDAGYAELYEKMLADSREKILQGIRECREEAKAKGRDVYLFCYERPGEFCHRYLVANFLQANGFDCRENPADRQCYARGVVPLVHEEAPELLNRPDDVTFAALTARRNASAAGQSPQSDNVPVFTAQGSVRPQDNDTVIVVGPVADSTLLERADVVYRSLFPKEGADLSDPQQAAAYRSEVLEPALDGILDTVREVRGETPAGGACIIASDGPEASMVAGLIGGSVRCRPVEGRTPAPAVMFTVSGGGYSGRTRENAHAADVTIQLAVDFTTAGERCTSSAAVGRCIPESLPLRDGRLDLSPAAVRTVADDVVRRLSDRTMPVSVNLAGNGMYTLARMGVTQDDLDVFVAALFMDLRRRGTEFASLRSGGQTGVDESVAAAAASLDVPVTVHAPQGWVFRDATGHDVRDREAFCGRFLKDKTLVRERAESILEGIVLAETADRELEVRSTASASVSPRR